MDTALIWFLVGVAFFLCEVFVPTLVVIFFGFGACAAALSSYLGASLAVDFAVFSVVSLTSCVLLRKYLKSIFQGNLVATGSSTKDAHHMAGSEGRVTKVIHPDVVGEIEVGGSFWRATSEVYLTEGSVVRVIGADPDNGLLLRVLPTSNVPAASAE